MPRFRVNRNCYQDFVGGGIPAYYVVGTIIEIPDGRDPDAMQALARLLDPQDEAASAMVDKPVAPAPAREVRQRASGSHPLEHDALARVRAALDRLDHADPSHWTQEGLPAVQAVNERIQGEPVGRSEIHAAAPGLVRQVPDE